MILRTNRVENEFIAPTKFSLCAMPPRKDPLSACFFYYRESLSCLNAIRCTPSAIPFPVADLPPQRTMRAQRRTRLVAVNPRQAHTCIFGESRIARIERTGERRSSLQSPSRHIHQLADDHFKLPLHPACSASFGDQRRRFWFCLGSLKSGRCLTSGYDMHIGLVRRGPQTDDGSRAALSRRVSASMPHTAQALGFGSRAHNKGILRMRGIVAG